MDKETHAEMQKELGQVTRHGYAAYCDNILIGWALTFDLAVGTKNTDRVVNVQNGAYAIVENGVIISENNQGRLYPNLMP